MSKGGTGLWVLSCVVLPCVIAACSDDASGGRGAVAGSSGSNSAGAPASGGVGGPEESTSGASGASGSAGEASAGESNSDAQMGGASSEGGASGAAGDAGESGAGAGGASDEFQIPRVDESDLAEPKADAGFIDIDATDYVASFEGSATQTAQATRLFYSFVPANDHAKERPVFVFFNGGPGHTSMLLASFGTGKRTFSGDAPSAPSTLNAASFSRFGNLIYIDSRQAGFSYGVTAHPDQASERTAGFAAANFNAAIDGADFTRALLRILKRQPAVRNNPVVIVGESYGGTRASVMLDLLLRPDRSSPQNESLVDATLSTEIHEHYAAVFPGFEEAKLLPEQRAKQFGWQVMIQPWLGGTLQRDEQNAVRDRVYARMTAASGLSRTQLDNNCHYHVLKPETWCDDVDLATTRFSTTPSEFQSYFSVALDQVPLLKASERGGAYRIGAGSAPQDPSAMLSLLGPLATWDQYFSLAASSSFSANGSPYYLYPFARNVHYVETLITNAQWDLVVMSEAIVTMLSHVTNPNGAGSLTSVSYEGAADLEHPTERVHLHFSAGPSSPELDRVVRFPRFSDSGHMVTVSEPAKFASEVQTFLNETGLPVE